MRVVLETLLLGLGAAAGLLAGYWAWQELALWRSSRQERRARRVR